MRGPEARLRVEMLDLLEEHGVTADVVGVLALDRLVTTLLYRQREVISKLRTAVMNHEERESQINNVNGRYVVPSDDAQVEFVKALALLPSSVA